MGSWYMFETGSLLLQGEAGGKMRDPGNEVVLAQPYSLHVNWTDSTCSFD